MKPDWDKLMEEFKGSPTALVGDADCTAAGKSLCDKNDVRGYPTIKWGEPGDLKDYDGGRDYASFKKFAEESLGPTCGPDNMDLCSAEVKKKLETFLGMSLDRLEGKARNAVRVVEEEVPLMKKVIAHMKKAKGDEL